MNKPTNTTIDDANREHDETMVAAVGLLHDIFGDSPDVDSAARALSMLSHYVVQIELCGSADTPLRVMYDPVVEQIAEAVVSLVQMFASFVAFGDSCWAPYGDPTAIEARMNTLMRRSSETIERLLRPHPGTRCVRAAMSCLAECVATIARGGGRWEDVRTASCLDPDGVHLADRWIAFARASRRLSDLTAGD